MSPIGPFRHVASPHDFGRKRSRADSETDAPIVSQGANDPKATFDRLAASYRDKRRGRRIEFLALIGVHPPRQSIPQSLDLSGIQRIQRLPHPRTPRLSPVFVDIRVSERL